MAAIVHAVSLTKIRVCLFCRFFKKVFFLTHLIINRMIASNCFLKNANSTYKTVFFSYTLHMFYGYNFYRIFNLSKLLAKKINVVLTYFLEMLPGEPYVRNN